MHRHHMTVRLQATTGGADNRQTIRPSNGARRHTRASLVRRAFFVRSGSPHCVEGSSHCTVGESPVVSPPNEINIARRVADCAIVGTRLNIIVIGTRTKPSKRRLNCLGNWLLTRRLAQTMVLLTNGVALFIGFIRARDNSR